MTYEQVRENAKKYIGDKCKSCPVCDGKGCKNKIPGPGAKGLGLVAMKNFAAWQDIYLNMDTLQENKEIDTSFSFLGHEFSLPVFAGPVGSVNLHYGDRYDDTKYNDILVTSCADSGILAFTGDGVNEQVMKSAKDSIQKNHGLGIPTIKPWDMATVFAKIDLVKTANPIAMAMDIDAAGLPFLKGLDLPAGTKSVAEMKKIIQYAGVPFIIKGIMTVQGAKKAVEAGAKAIIVSNHGGRVLDQCPATACVLPEIVEAVKKDTMVIVDGGIRTGIDVFKALALGADAVLIARPFVNAVFGAEKEGVEVFIQKLKNELIETMQMTGASKLKDISSCMIRKQKI